MKERAFLLIELIIFLSVFISIEAIPSNACVEPYSGMEIAEDTEFCPGEHYLSGSIKVVSDNIRLNCNGARLYTEGVPGIYIGNRSSISVDNCVISSFGAAISTCKWWDCYPLSYSKINNNMIVGSSGIVIKDTSGSGKSKDNIISNNVISSDFGIDMRYSSENIIKNNSIGTRFEAVSLRFSDKNIIESNRIAAGPDSYGIDMQYSDKNRISNNIMIRGIKVNGVSNLILSNDINEGRGNFHGEGVLLMPGSGLSEITENLIAGGFSNGIYLRNSPKVIVVANEIRDNLNGISVYGDSWSSNVTLNSIFHNRYYNIANNNNETLNAEQNYFGTINPFLIKNKISGPVDYCPLLDAPYPEGKVVDCDEFCKKTGICPKP